MYVPQVPRRLPPGPFRLPLCSGGKGSLPPIKSLKRTMVYLSRLLWFAFMLDFTGAFRKKSLGIAKLHTTRLFGDVLVTNLDTKETATLPAGSPVSLACVRTNLRLSFQCKKGDCGSCEFLLDGKVTRSCITKVPDKKSITVAKKPIKRP